MTIHYNCRKNKITLATPHFYIMGRLVKSKTGNHCSRWIFWLNEHNEKLLAADTTKALHHIHVKQ